MVEEDNTNDATEDQTVEAPNEVVETKKKRAPRRTAAELAAVAAAKSEKTAQRKNAKPKTVSSAAMDKPVAVSKRPVANSSTAKLSAGPSTTPATAVDEMADLLKLEEENRSLRGQLSEKLRTENADLRRRLAQA